MERGISKQKQECIALRTAIENTTDNKAKFELEMKYQKACNRIKSQNMACSDFSREKGMRPLEERLKVAEWTREDSRRSLRAAKQYETIKNLDEESNDLLTLFKNNKGNKSNNNVLTPESYGRLEKIGFEKIDNKL